MTTTRRLALHRYPASHAVHDRAPLLFIHGGYSNSRCWETNFIPGFTALGHDCYALDFSGHGDSQGHERLDDFGLDDYTADLAQTLAELDAEGVQPILIAHSMGCLIAQRFLEQGQARGIAFLAPVPASGTAGAASRLAMRVHDFFDELPRATSGQPTQRTLEVMAEVYFSPCIEHAKVVEFLPMIQPESDRAVAEMVTTAFRLARPRPEIRALVVGGSRDAVFPASLLHFTASSWRARCIVIAEAGHMLMLDPQWPEVMARIADWIAAEPAAR